MWSLWTRGAYHKWLDLSLSGVWSALESPTYSNDIHVESNFRSLPIIQLFVYLYIQ